MEGISTVQEEHPIPQIGEFHMQTAVDLRPAGAIQVVKVTAFPRIASGFPVGICGEG